ncbi:MAG: Methyl coenzyme M reductase [Candidatus Alkanophagales archaeon MCA70_species_1]|nr:Methyl coenzyme M reductase [Candidatus Alkanophaga volatiphilum]
MAVRHPDRIDLHDERGERIAEDIPLDAISPLHNPAIKKICETFKRSVIVNLRRIEDSLRSGRMGGEMGVGEECQIPGIELDLPIVENAEKIAELVDRYVRVSDDDDTSVHVLGGGEILFVQVPTLRMYMASDWASATVNVGVATAHAIIELFNITPFNGSNVIKSAIFGRYPQSITLRGAVTGLLRGWPPALDGVGLAFRTNMVNDIVAITNKNTLNGVALSAILETLAMFDSGDAIHPVYERYHLLRLAYQGLNANNLVYELVKENGKDGTIGTVILSLIRRAEEDGVIKVKETLPSGFKIYKTDDACLWNAYMAAGQLAAVIVNCGAMRAVQGAPATINAFNDIIKLATGLPDLDFGRVLGTSIGFAFYTHNIYGGAGPGAYAPAGPLLRHSRGFIAPCIVAGMCMDAGTQTFTPELTSGVYMKIRDVLPPEMKQPIKYVAEAASEIKDKL